MYLGGKMSGIKARGYPEISRSVGRTPRDLLMGFTRVWPEALYKIQNPFYMYRPTYEESYILIAVKSGESLEYLE